MALKRLQVESKRRLRGSKLNPKGRLETQDCKDTKMKFSPARELDFQGCKSTRNRAKRGQVALGVRLEALQCQPHGAKWHPSGAKLRLERGLQAPRGTKLRLECGVEAASCTWRAAWRAPLGLPGALRGLPGAPLGLPGGLPGATLGLSGAL